MTDINNLRNEIDCIDKKIINAIKERFNIVSKIAQYKNSHQLPIVNSERGNQVLQQNCEYAKTLALDCEFIQDIFEKIIHHSIKYQELHSTIKE